MLSKASTGRIREAKAPCGKTVFPEAHQRLKTAFGRKSPRLDPANRVSTAGPRYGVSPEIHSLSLAPVFILQFHQGVEVFTNLLLRGFHVGFIRNVLSVPDFFSLLSLGTHFHLHAAKIKDPDEFRIIKKLRCTLHNR
jgi:hypothetical protein